MKKRRRDAYFRDLSNLREQLQIKKKLEENEYLTGPKVTIADVQFLTTVRWMSSGILDGIPATCLDPFPKIKAFKEKMEAIPEVAAYLESTKKK